MLICLLASRNGKRLCFVDVGYCVEQIVKDGQIRALIDVLMGIVITVIFPVHIHRIGKLDTTISGTWRNNVEEIFIGLFKRQCYLIQTHTGL